MKRFYLSCFVFLVAGSLALLILIDREGELRREVESAKVKSVRRAPQKAIARTSDLRVADLAFLKNDLKDQSLLEQVKCLDHLSPDDLKSLVDEIFRWGEKVPNGEARLLFEPVMELACATIPEWFLLRTEEDWKSGKEHRWWKTSHEKAFLQFLKIDPEGALRWYESGRFERPPEYYEKHELREMAMAELLIRAPERALELAREELFPGDRGFRGFRAVAFRFDDLDQLQRFQEVVEQSSELDFKKWSDWIVREGYRLGGTARIHELMNKDLYQNLGRNGRYSLLRKLGNGVKSEQGINDLLELLEGADAEVKGQIIVTYFGTWAWEDLPTAEKLVEVLPTSGPVTEKGWEAIIRTKAEHNPEGARALLNEISDIQVREELLRWIEVSAKSAD